MVEYPAPIPARHPRRGAIIERGSTINTRRRVRRRWRRVRWRRAGGRVNFRLRDWGEPPALLGLPDPGDVHCAACGAVPVPEDQLPVLLPEDVADAFASGDVHSPIKSDPDWRKTTCPQCGGRPSARPTPSTPSWRSSWYYARYTSPGAATWSTRAQLLAAGGPVHRRHRARDPAPDVFPLLPQAPARRGLVGSDEPATRLLTQGMVIAETFYRGTPTNRPRTGSIRPTSNVQRDERMRVVGAKLKADGQSRSDRRHREDVEVEEQRRRSAGDGGQVRRRHRAPVLDVRRAAGTVAGMERGRRRRHGALPAPVLARVTHAAQPGPSGRRPLRLDAAQKVLLRRQLHETIRRSATTAARRQRLQHRDRRR